MSHQVDIEATRVSYESQRQTAGGRKDKFTRPSWMLEWPLITFSQKKALRTGTVAGAALVMANEGIFKPGKLNLGGHAIYSFDPYYTENDHAALVELAHNIFSLRGMQNPPAELRGMVNIVTIQTLVPLRQRVPDMLTGGREVYMTTLQFARKNLPGGVLDVSIFPIVVTENTTPDALLLPYRYWVFK